MDSRVKTRWIVSAGLAMAMACGVAHAEKGTAGKPAGESEVTSEPVPPQVVAAAVGGGGEAGR